MKYILDANGNPKREPSAQKWAAWMQANRDGLARVGDDMVGDSPVSTVFLGLSYVWETGPSDFWETMVFGGELDRLQERCGGNREQAEAMHASVVQRVRDAAKSTS